MVALCHSACGLGVREGTGLVVFAGSMEGEALKALGRPEESLPDIICLGPSGGRTQT